MDVHPHAARVAHPRRAAPRISVVIPTLNEARNLPYVFAGLPDDLFEVIVVDGYSSDDTVAVARSLRPDVRVVYQTRPGKGAALRCGFAACRGDIIVMLDADGSADGAEIPRFVSALQNGADFAKGSRFLPGGGSADITRLRRAGNRGLIALVNALFGTRYSDLCYGYNAFWAHCLAQVSVDCAGFEVETLLNIRVATAGLRVREVASFEGRRIHGASNLNAWRDGRRVLRTIITERFARPVPAAGVGPVVAEPEATPRAAVAWRMDGLEAVRCASSVGSGGTARRDIDRKVAMAGARP